MTATISQIRNTRINKVTKLLELGINPYPSDSKKEYANREIVENFGSFEGKVVTVAGRLMSWREHGNIIFAHIQDQSGRIQLFIKEKELEKTSPDKQTIGFDNLNLLDVGDFIQATGTTVKTLSGEVSVTPKEIKILTKSIMPLPSIWHGLKDIEERYRKRYLDMLLNDQVSKRLQSRSQIITAIRHFFDERGFLEVETPTLQPIYGGGFARPFITHHNALDTDFYLRISDEMYLKRLIVGGFQKVYEITKVFRNEGVDHDHNPEFTMFEAQIAFEDYNYGMDIVEELIEYVALKTTGGTEVSFGEHKLNFQRPWKRLKLTEAIKEYTGQDPESWKTEKEAKTAVKSMGIREEKLKELSKMTKLGEVISFAFEEAVEEKLIQPTIVYDYPIEVSPLSKKCKDERFTQRFEIFAAGMELGNNYTELNDPIDLKQRFIEEKEREKAGFDEAHQTDYDYLEAIEHGFPPTCGLGIGVDRLVMILTGAQSIKEVIAFPTLKPKDINESKDA